MTTAAPDPLRDRVVAAVGDSYIIEGELGRGGMAVVYRALDVRLNRRVAVKVLPPELAYHADVRERFLREAQTAAALNHPNIVPIFSVDERAGIVFFVMALVDGDSVAEMCRRSRECPPEETARILSEVADALAFAHANGVVHRDIKPDNILVERASGRPMVTDFGIARAMAIDARLTLTGVAMGTPTYMSPEQAMGEREVDGRSDQYSLAVVGYEMLAGAPPFRASNSPALLMKHVAEPPVPIWQLRDRVPATLGGALMRALAKKPEERWEDAGRFRDAVAGSGSAGAAAAAIAFKGGIESIPAAPEPLPRYEPPARRQFAPEHGSLQDRARAEGRAPHHQERSRVRPPVPVGPALPPLNPRPSRRELADRIERAAAPREKPLVQEVHGFHRHLWGTGSGVLVCWAVNLMTSPEFLWAVFPTLGMGMGLLGHATRVRGRGANWRQLFGREKTPALSRDEVRKLGPDGVAAGLVGRDVLDGPYGDAVRRAAADRMAIDDVVMRLSKAELAMIPDVAPTAQALLDRIAALASTLHRLELDLSGASMEALEARLGHVRSESASADQARRLMLLERQQQTLRELGERQAAIQGQLESAQLALGNLKLDLYKLRSAGIAAGIADVTSATQQARAVSRDIAHAVEAAREIERL